MALQRQVSPIPPGRYWMTIQGGAEIRDFDAWVRDMAGAVRITSTELDRSGPKPVLFVVFEVPEGRFPFLNALQFGFPEHAPANVTSRQDVEQSPPVPSPLQRAEELANKAAEGAGNVAGLALLLLALFALKR